MSLRHAFSRTISLVALVLPSMVSGAAVAQPNVHLCDLVNAQFPGKVGFANSTEYKASQTSYYTADARDVVPQCVFRPTSATDVANFVKLATANDPCGSRCSVSHPLFAVRGGGHTLWAGAANAGGSVTVDMRGLDSFSLSKDLKTASIGAGSDFSKVYPALAPHNLTVMGARVPGVAAGGFLLGGGKNFLSRRYGFGCDNIYGYEVVLASGQITYASAGQNEDLWMALKGGSNNFGIVTRYDVATYPLSLMWGGTQSLNLTPAALQAEAQAFSDFMLPQNLDDAADVGVLIGFLNGALFLENTIFYSDPVANPLVFRNFTQIPSITSQSLNLSTVAERVDADGSVVPPSLAHSFELVFTFANAPAAVYAQMFEILQAGLEKIAKTPGLEAQYLLQPMPVTNGTNSLGLPAHRTDLAMALITTIWDNEADSDTVISITKSIVQQQEALLSKADLLIPFKYLNYADVTQNPISTYGLQNVAKLWAASRKYDPRGLWQTRVPGYKLPTIFGL